MPAGAAVEAVGLTTRYADVTAIDDLTFRVRERSVTGFLGPNGAGKTTTLRMVLGLARPSAGEATFGGRRCLDLDDPAPDQALVLLGWVAVFVLAAALVGPPPRRRVAGRAPRAAGRPQATGAVS
jgi:ABC-type branched-subunit amino acid transport system ATPase component